MPQKVGTISRGLIAPIVHAGDDIAAIAVETLLSAAASEGFAIQDRDILAVTESVVARAQGNYATVDQIAADIRKKFGNEHIALIFPILSRNRFAICLEGIAKAGNQLTIVLSYPADEVGNRLMDPNAGKAEAVNPWTDSFTADSFIQHFGSYKHPFTGIDYIAYYQSIIKKYNQHSSILLANDPCAALNITKYVLACDIHTREHTKQSLKDHGAVCVYGLDEILTESVDGSGYNSCYGLLGSNKATESSVKLFPNDCQALVEKMQAMLKEKTGKTVEVLVYGDGAFKDPVGKIWELADPVVSPGFTKGLAGTPHEVKLKYLADNNFKHLSAEAQYEAMVRYIDEHKKNAQSSLIDQGEAEGTTPRQLTDLIGSLCDLTSGSGDKGTPIIFIQNYFKKFGE
ncbi:MAG: coenzyme F420-0:L-glutamate ligase [Treponema sp.]|uniref:coenzyme F420-0:L-glutamate ligase n=1 Tax=Treponema sp. TaxID=166 RepID=UPI003FA3027B